MVSVPRPELVGSHGVTATASGPVRRDSPTLRLRRVAYEPPQDRPCYPHLTWHHRGSVQPFLEGGYDLPEDSKSFPHYHLSSFIRTKELHCPFPSSPSGPGFSGRPLVVGPRIRETRFITGQISVRPRAILLSLF
jgi:hypothetical protein